MDRGPLPFIPGLFRVKHMPRRRLWTCGRFSRRSTPIPLRRSSLDVTAGSQAAERDAVDRSRLAHPFGSGRVVVLGTVHLLLVVGLRNRLSVFLGWTSPYATYEVGVQLITGLPLAGDAPRRPANSLDGE
jgi:hypothetical protein